MVRAACSGWSRWSKSKRPQGRIAYGPVSAEAVPGLFDAGFLEGKPHALRLGPTEEIPYLKQQERLTFARCGITDPLSLSDYVSHGGYRGLERALNADAAGDRGRGHQLRTARARRRGLSHRHQVAHRSQRAVPIRNTLSATPTKATAAPTPTA